LSVAAIQHSASRILAAPRSGAIAVRSSAMLGFFSPTESIRSTLFSTGVTPTTITGSVFIYN
jgi:hypothetical protein